MTATDIETLMSVIGITILLIKTVTPAPICACSLKAREMLEF